MSFKLLARLMSSYSVEGVLSAGGRRINDIICLTLVRCSHMQRWSKSASVLRRNSFSQWHSLQAHPIYNAETNSSSNVVILAAAGLLGLFGLSDEDDSGRIPTAVKRELLRGHKAQNNQEYSAASRFYHNALQLLANSPKRNEQNFIEARAFTTDKLANLYLEEGKLTKAESAFKETMRLIIAATQSSGKQEMEALIEISLKLSQIYSNQKRFSEAAVGFQWCIDQATKCCEDEKTENRYSLLGICYGAQSKFHVMRNDFSSALKPLLESKKICEELFGTASVQYATILSDEATILMGINNKSSNEKAELLLQESCEVMESLQSKDPAVIQSLAVVYCNRAILIEGKDKSDSRIGTFLMKSISLLEPIKNEYLLSDLELYYYKLGMHLIGQGKVDPGRVSLNAARTITMETGNDKLTEHIDSILDSSKHI